MERNIKPTEETLLELISVLRELIKELKEKQRPKWVSDKSIPWKKK
jgi:hypothetical protein